MSGQTPIIISFLPFNMIAFFSICIYVYFFITQQLYINCLIYWKIGILLFCYVWTMGLLFGDIWIHLLLLMFLCLKATCFNYFSALLSLCIVIDHFSLLILITFNSKLLKHLETEVLRKLSYSAFYLFLTCWLLMILHFIL